MLNNVGGLSRTGKVHHTGILSCSEQPLEPCWVHQLSQCKATRNPHDLWELSTVKPLKKKGVLPVGHKINVSSSGNSQHTQFCNKLGAGVLAEFLKSHWEVRASSQVTDPGFGSLQFPVKRKKKKTSGIEIFPDCSLSFIHSPLFTNLIRLFYFFSGRIWVMMVRQCR